MQLILHRPDEPLFVRRVEDAAVIVVDQRMSHSFAMDGRQLLADLPLVEVAQIDEVLLEQVLKLEPDVLLIGVGAGPARPDPRILGPVLRRGIGCEMMDNGACGRTFNVLLREGRRVAALFILPTPAAAGA